MSVEQFSEWLASTAFSQSIQLTSWAIPAIQTVHILALSLVATAALLFALRLLGRGLAAEPLAQLAARFTRLIWLLLVVLLLSGLLLIIAEPYRTLSNPVFYAKMIMLVVVSLVTLWLAAAARRDPPRVAVPLQFAAVATLLLWVGIIFAGRFIAYYESY